ncbi:MAG TPA: hypothetical protein VLK33_22215, partial [Terriglobales bacterium]|nr:hypothetical protein [Terriglobales bacterium]
MPDEAKSPTSAGEHAAPAAPAKPAGPVPTPWESPLVSDLHKRYGSGIAESSTYLGQNYFVVESSIVFDVLTVLKDEKNFDYCVDITAVHYPQRE